MFRNPWEIDWSDPQQVRQQTQRPPRIQGPERQPTPRYPDEAVRSQNQADASAFDPRTAEANARHAEAQARLAEAQLNAGGGTPVQRATLATRQANMEAATQQLLRLGNLYRSGYEGGNIFEAIGESLPDFVSPGNSQFNSAAAGLSEAAFAALRVPGVGTQSDAELRQFLRANEPRAQAYDETIEERLDTVQTRLNAQREAMGLPPVDWRNPPTVALPGEQMDRTSQFSVNPNTQTAITPNEQGDTRIEEDPTLRALAGRLGRMIAGGATDREIMELLQANNVSPTETNIGAILQFRRTPDFRQWKQQNPNSPYPITDTFWRREISQGGGRQFFSDVANSDTGAYFVNAGQALTGNRLDDAIGMLGGDRDIAQAGIAGLREQNPYASMAGDISGQLLAYAGGNAALGRFAPAGVSAALSRANPVARGVGADLAYGGYAGSGDGNMLEGALFNAAGGEIGRRASRGAGRIISGTSDLATRELSDRGVRLTLGDIAGQGGIPGNIVRAAEQRLSGMPVVGDLISNQSRRGIKSGVRAAHQEALTPIGGTATTAVGEEAMDDSLAQIGEAFRNATRGVTLRRDPQFDSQFRSAILAGRRKAIPAEQRAVVESALTQINDFIEGGVMTGDGLQASLQVLGEARSAVAGQPLSKATLTTLRQAERAVIGMARRQAPAVMPALTQARQAYRRAMILRDATGRAVNDAEGVFTPGQLGMAMRSQTNKYGGRTAATSTRRPFHQLHDAMRQVMPNRIPDSGTPGRAAMVGGLMVAGGAGSDAMGWTDQGAQTAALLAALGLPYTTAGQEALQTLLVRRPEVMRSLGEIVKQRGGLFGRRTGASLLPYNVTEEY